MRKRKRQLGPFGERMMERTVIEVHGAGREDGLEALCRALQAPNPNRLIVGRQQLDYIRLVEESRTKLAADARQEIMDSIKAKLKIAADARAAEQAYNDRQWQRAMDISTRQKNAVIDGLKVKLKETTDELASLLGKHRLQHAELLDRAHEAAIFEDVSRTMVTLSKTFTEKAWIGQRSEDKLTFPNNPPRLPLIDVPWRVNPVYNSVPTTDTPLPLAPDTFCHMPGTWSVD